MTRAAVESVGTAGNRVRSSSPHDSLGHLGGDVVLIPGEVQVVAGVRFGGGWLALGAAGGMSTADSMAAAAAPGSGTRYVTFGHRIANAQDGRGNATCRRQASPGGCCTWPQLVPALVSAPGS
eukprot:3316368-Rhodomonas_salina.2